MNKKIEELLLKLNDNSLKKKLPIIRELLKHNDSNIIPAIIEFLDGTDDIILKTKVIRMIKKSDACQIRNLGPKISKPRIDNINPFLHSYGSGRTQ